MILSLLQGTFIKTKHGEREDSWEEFGDIPEDLADFVSFDFKFYVSLALFIQGSRLR